MRLANIAFILWSSLSCVAAATPHIVPMLRHAGDVTARVLKQSGNLTGGVPEMGKLRAIGAATTIQNAYDTAYYTSIQVGTPPVWFTAIIDTGSSDLWVPGTKYTGKSIRYDPSASSTSLSLNIPVTTWYGIGSASGTIVADTVRIGAVESKQSVFIQADSSSNIQPPGVDGLLGLGFSGMSWANDKAPKTMKSKTSFVENCYRDKLIDEPAFGVWLDRYTYTNTAPSGVVGGELAIGSSEGNPARFTGPITWLDVPSWSWWHVMADGISGPDGVNLLSGGRTVRSIVDTGTALILVDYAVAEKLNSFVGAWATSIRGLWAIDCTKLATSNVVFTLSFQGKKFTLSGADLPTRVWPDDANTCYAPFQGKSNQDVIDPWMLGDVFLRKYYSIYDANAKGGWRPRVGFALATH